MERFDQARIAACLAHVLPEVCLELVGTNGSRVVVGANRLDADVHPCRLRAALVAPSGAAWLERVAAIEVVSGVHDLGGGIWQRDAGGRSQRWLVTTLAHPVASAVFDTCVIDVPPASMNVRFFPDGELGCTALRIQCNDRRAARRLDEVAVWAAGACLAEELVAMARAVAR